MLSYRRLVFNHATEADHSDHHCHYHYHCHCLGVEHPASIPSYPPAFTMTRWKIPTVLKPSMRMQVPMPMPQKTKTKTTTCHRTTLLSCIMVMGTLCAANVCNAFLPQAPAFHRNILRSRQSSSSMHRLHALHSLPRSNATISIAGVDYQRPQKVNQDNHFQCGDGISYAAFGVLDGHGLKGHILTQYLAHQLPQRLQQCPSEADPFQESLQRYGYDTTTHHSNATAWLTRTFHQCHWDAVQDPNVNAGRNGATCIVCVFEAPISDDDPSLLHVACVGDSRAIRIRRDNSIDILASETTVHLPDERKRIAKGSIRGNNVFYGPVGIAMTRSLGNAVMLRAGVIPTPIVRTYDWKEGDVVCIATDGVWDVLRNEAVAQIVIEETDATIIAERIVEAAKAKWIGNLPIQDEVKMDDITCTIIR